MADNMIRLPQPVEPPKLQITQQAPEEMPIQRKKNKLADLFEVPQAEDNDIYADDLTEITDEDIMGGNPDISDLVDVNKEDITGYKSEPVRRKRRTKVNYQQPPTMGGVNY